MVADSLRFARRDPASLWAARQIGIKALDSVRDVHAINRYLKKNETPWDRQTREAQEQRDRIAAQSAQQTAQFQQTIQRQQEANAAMVAKVSQDIKSGYESRIDDLVSSIDSERSRFQSQFNALQAQYDKQTTAFNDLNLQYKTLSDQNAEQQRLAANASRASVPTPVQSAELPISGDQRESSARKGKDNNLSSLTVLTGLNPGGNQSSGLQLA